MYRKIFDSYKFSYFDVCFSVALIWTYKCWEENYSFVLTHLFPRSVESSGSFILAKLSPMKAYASIERKASLSKQTLSSLIEVTLYSKYELLGVNSFANVTRKF